MVDRTLVDLDSRVMAMADRIERAGGPDDADALRASMAYIRETMSGADMGSTLADDLEVLKDGAEQAYRIVVGHLDLTER